MTSCIEGYSALFEKSERNEHRDEKFCSLDHVAIKRFMSTSSDVDINSVLDRSHRVVHGSIYVDTKC